MEPKQWWQYQGRDFNEAESQGKVGFIYEIFFPNGKRYLGQRVFRSGWKSYVGRGVLVTNYVSKHGTSGIKRTILELHDDVIELDNAENKITRERGAVASKKYYNLIEGGRRAGFTQAVLKSMSKKMTGRKDTPATTAKRIAGQKRRNSKPGASAARSASSRKVQSNPAYRAKRSKISKEMWKKHGYREKFSKGHEKSKNKGENHQYAKLKNSDINFIRQMRTDGLYASEIAEYYKVQPSCIDSIMKGKTWKSVPAQTKDEWTPETQIEYNRLIDGIVDPEIRRQRLKNPRKDKGVKRKKVITEDMVPEILLHCLRGRSVTTIASIMDFESASTVHDVAGRKTWKHITDEYFEDPEFARKFEFGRFLAKTKIELHQVPIIKRKVDAGTTPHAIQKEYGLTPRTLTKILEMSL